MDPGKMSIHLVNLIQQNVFVDNLTLNVMTKLKQL